jgi:hypothetical protein
MMGGDERVPVGTLTLAENRPWWIKIDANALKKEWPCKTALRGNQ